MQKRRRPAAGKTPRPDNVINVKWRAGRCFMPAGMPEHLAFFRMETLQNAVEHLLTIRDPYVQAAFRKTLGADTQLKTLSFDLASEEANRFLFLATGGSRQIGQTTLGWVVARNHQEFGTAVKAGWEGLRLLHRAAPALTTYPLVSGFVFMPDRHGRTAMGRELPGYFVAWPEGAAPLHAGRPDQLSLRFAEGFKLLTRAETEIMRKSMAELALRAYNPERGVGVNLSAINPEDILGWRGASGKNPTGIRAYFSRARETRTTPGRYLTRVLQAAWPTPAGPCPWTPSDPEVFAGVLRTVAGEGAADWMLECAEQQARIIRGGGERTQFAHGQGYIETLREIMLK